ncbi:predicted protein [Chaetomium globosum CBS 148.51]|uniref:Uncharacterized protein n=1 Tax=Chaetomium globosum (strain ATCC 6205 / CBS 148.51 / DSM 1962 / NBRC 6347 / NRRL 1970) TaxID=306901 RepID=Q2HA97_CHAGB|nr:uncharacterized protein CHGG_02857 [Chaetomium globosum CBS 148.51]EAQ90922.1 predicted protein [Chaetomium globosum CBS 148.51]
MSPSRPQSDLEGAYEIGAAAWPSTETPGGSKPRSSVGLPAAGAALPPARGLDIP